MYVSVLIILALIVYWMVALDIEPGVMPQLIGFVAVVSPFVIYYYLKDKES